ncbi:nucleotide-diphospho-sugar transferase [Cercophora samala]|uniref:Nucleotide-diphospho-sugar transferase n=1 Tax=Cercophora samala TaxID=330535 RepID=A0AA40DFL7_9PEZI|nr:nucleotide-diphospho-sugar transferase [Cercophora samala]
MSDGTRVVDSDRGTFPPLHSLPLVNSSLTTLDPVYTTLITSLSYLPGLLTLHYSLVHRTKSKYPLIALYTSSFPESGLAILRRRNIPHQLITPLSPSSAACPNPPSYSHDPRFRECFTKLIPFSLVQYSRIVQLDSDMLLLRNIDSLFDIELDSDKRVFAASHACLCNPCGFAHYPAYFRPENCFYNDPAGVGGEYLNGGLQVVRPDLGVYKELVGYMGRPGVDLSFADQSVLAGCFQGRWVGLGWEFNALKTMRWRGVHDKVWRDGEVRNVHYILTPKPWEEERDEKGRVVGGKRGEDRVTSQWWVDVDNERREWEEERGIRDGW